MGLLDDLIASIRLAKELQVIQGELRQQLAGYRADLSTVKQELGETMATAEEMGAVVTEIRGEVTRLKALVDSIMQEVSDAGMPKAAEDSILAQMKELRDGLKGIGAVQPPTA